MTMRNTIQTRTSPFALSALAVAIALSVAAPIAQAEDLVQIYQQARAADPTLAAADANRNATKENVPQARSYLLPQINGSYGYQRNNIGTNNTGLSQDPTTGDFLDGTTGEYERDRSRPGSLTLNQSIFDWANITRLRSASAQAEGADFTYDAASQDLLVRTAQAYFGVLTAEDQLDFAQLNEKSLGKQLEQVEQKFDVGLLAITDVYVARAQHDAAVAQVITARNDVDTARESLIQIIGKDFGDLKKLRDPVPLDKPQPTEVQAWVDLAYKQNPSLASAQKSVDAADINIQTARAGHLPTITGTLARSNTPLWSNTTAPASFNGTQHGNNITGETAIGIQLNVPIFSGGMVSSQTRQAVYQRDAAQDQLELTRRTIAANTRNAYRAVISGISEVEATKAAIVSAQGAVDATQAGYEVGTKTILDVLTSQANLLSAQSAYSQARHQFVLNGLQLKEAAGVVSAKDLQAVNALLQ